MAVPVANNLEWLEADGLGGFASGTTSGIRTRRYHALLLTAVTPPTGRFVLVNGMQAWIETPTGVYPLTSHCYMPNVIHPDGAHRIDLFEIDPWPQWTYQLEDGTRLRFELFVPHGASAVVLSWRLLERRKDISLILRPLCSGRDHHALHQENPSFCFDPQIRNGQIVWRPYYGVPGIVAFASGAYTHHPEWHRQFLYTEEKERGLDSVEDLASPGVFRWDLSQGEAFCIFAAEGREPAVFSSGATVEACFRSLRLDEQRRRQRFPSPLDRSADAYLVRRGQGKTVVAGYPWFTDWGRDSFIALRGLCLATGRFDEARKILLEWAGTVSDGMLPNRFADQGDKPEFNAVDASLWFVIAVHDYLQAVEKGTSGGGWRVSGNSADASSPATRSSPPATQDDELDRHDRQALLDAVEAILLGYSRGTRFGIRADSDALLAAGLPGLALTWMDAKAGDQAFTPRIGKPVEVQALWLNALSFASRFSSRWGELFQEGLTNFRKRFWNERFQCLYDVIDVDHRPGVVDDSFRPNQIFAVGGLPLMLLEPERAAWVVEAVQAKLWTPLGLRTLAPGEPGYQAHMKGTVRQRDGAYHQGTAWPWLLGPFVEAWLRVHGHTSQAIEEARKRFLQPLMAHLDVAGLGHLPEVADGDPPHQPRGCPFQAWSLGELLRLDRLVLTAEKGR